MSNARLGEGQSAPESGRLLFWRRNRVANFITKAAVTFGGTYAAMETGDQVLELASDNSIPTPLKLVVGALTTSAQVIRSRRRGEQVPPAQSQVAADGPATKLPDYYFNRPPDQESIFHDRTDGPFLDWMASQGLPLDAHDGLIARHMEEVGTVSVLPAEYQKTGPHPSLPAYANVRTRY